MRRFKQGVWEQALTLQNSTLGDWTSGTDEGDWNEVEADLEQYLDEAHEALNRLHTRSSRRSKTPARYPKIREAWN